MQDVTVRRLTGGDRQPARELFRLFSEVFEEPAETLSDAYLDVLLIRDEFWAMAAFLEDRVVGGITAHTLPMTRSESRELFIYDLAVHTSLQRRGIGRRLVDDLRVEARAQGIDLAFVPAEDEDQHALDFYRALGADESAVHFFVFDESV